MALFILIYSGEFTEHGLADRKQTADRQMGKKQC